MNYTHVALIVLSLTTTSQAFAISGTESISYTPDGYVVQVKSSVNTASNADASTSQDQSEVRTPAAQDAKTCADHPASSG